MPKRKSKWRKYIGRLLLLLFVLWGLGPDSAPPRHALGPYLQRVTAPYRFDLVDWESWAVADEIERRLKPPPLPESEAARTALVQQYLAQEEQQARLKQEIGQVYAACPDPDPAHCPAESDRLAELEQELAALKAAHARLAPQVEMILAQQIEAVLHDEGLTRLGIVFPPVAFRFIEPPTFLIISPRDRIEKMQTRDMQPGLETALRAQIEESLNRRGDVSSYITDIGGMGSYPTMVVSHGWLPHLVDTIAHEWTHNYLFTFPTNLGWYNHDYPRLITLNETTASLAGEEISRKVITRFYPDWVDKLPPLDEETGQPAPPAPSEFHLAMRRIRLRVDELLAQGKIEEAEAYMETERQKLVEKGHYLRRLNQAYFAFHGSYALSPGSVDPTGAQLRQLRAESGSLKAFLDRVGWINSYDDYLAWLEEAGLDQMAER